MLVHKFYLVECIGFEFKFDLNSIRFELVWKRKEDRKEKRKQNPTQETGPTQKPLGLPPRPGSLRARPTSSHTGSPVLSPARGPAAAHTRTPAPARPSAPARQPAQNLGTRFL